MQIESFKYSQHENDPREWRLENVQFGAVTLLVGRNASGKTRTLNVINGLAKLLTGEMKPAYRSGNYVVNFRDGETAFLYELRYHDSAVTLEEFSKDGKKLLHRGPDGIGKIFAEKLNTDLEFQSPPLELAAVTRRDSIQHPFFESLYNWGKGVRHFAFGSPLGQNNLAAVTKDKEAPFNPNDTGSAVAVFRRGIEEFGSRFTDATMADMAKLDYHLEEIGIRPPEMVILQVPTGNTIVGLYAKERKLNMITEQFEMSQGMFRALSVLGQLNYAELKQMPNCIIIDDIGEGLDFERSCSLVELLIEKATSSKTQLIMSTNDRFVMNRVPLEYWAVIQRRNNTCRFFNYANSKKQFEEFKFTGMNNFDFFATDFLGANSSPNEEAGNLR
jgi:energy-coupling factor transporter ATP-binding protein EcfA2